MAKAGHWGAPREGWVRTSEIKAFFRETRKSEGLRKADKHASAGVAARMFISLWERGRDNLMVVAAFCMQNFNHKFEPINETKREGTKMKNARGAKMKNVGRMKMAERGV